ncbi:MAG: ATP-binding cassette domain-containing protein [Erysipelotrichaceae bacterium]|jgi:ABC-type oligopeptide transport system ATPase subunit|nr:ATP-binding cassette domain-containing protein [Erysipelotrichaceae bacterium]MCB9499995.1 ATP-binding cassette domain-containing protein [Erysipelotrichaceae bacterium]
MNKKKNNDINNNKPFETVFVTDSNGKTKPVEVVEEKKVSDKEIAINSAPTLDEIKGSLNKELALENIKSKCKFKQDLVDNNVILSVNHLKQYFVFGKGPSKIKIKAVHDVNFKIKSGECFGLVGESGCGKTTTGRSIIRLYDITSGSIYYKGYRIGAGARWNEKEIKYTNIRYHAALKALEADKKTILSMFNAHTDIDKIHEKFSGYPLFNNVEEANNFFAKKKAENKEYRDNVIKVQKAKISQIRYDETHVDKKLMSEIQMIFQDPIDSLDPRMTVEDIIKEGLTITHTAGSKEEAHNKVCEALEKVGLIADYANRYPHEFSGGQRQRIGIARALVMNPRFLICDEPISALDVSIRAQIINLLNQLKEEMNLTIMFIAHDLSVVKYFCDRIAVMYFGELVEVATSDELFKHPLHPYTKSLLSAIPKPNPLTEKDRVRIVYDPRKEHDYSVERPRMVEIVPGHFILANTPEIEKYKKEIALLDSKK